VLLAAFFVQANPSATALNKIVAHLHLEHGVDAREAVDHHRDERAVAQADEGGFGAFRLAVARRVSCDWHTVEQLPRLFGRQHGRLAFFHDVFGAAHGVGRIHLKDVADHQPVEQHAERGQVLLDRGRRELAFELLDECGDVEGLDGGEFPDASPLAPCREAARGIHVRLARVVVVDLGGEEFEDALGGFRRRRESGPRTTAGAGEGIRAVLVLIGSLRTGFVLGSVIECYKGTLSHTKTDGRGNVVRAIKPGRLRIVRAVMPLRGAFL